VFFLFLQTSSFLEQIARYAPSFLPFLPPELERVFTLLSDIEPPPFHASLLWVYVPHSGIRHTPLVPCLPSRPDGKARNCSPPPVSALKFPLLGLLEVPLHDPAAD